MQVQRVNNQQSFTSTRTYEMAIPQRVQAFVGDLMCKAPKDEKGIKADTALAELKKLLTKGKPKQVFGNFVKSGLLRDIYHAPRAVQIGEDVIILDESKAPTQDVFASTIRILFGKDASEGTIEIKRDAGMGKDNISFDEVAKLIKTVANQ